jgi:hypothetical protein
MVNQSCHFGCLLGKSYPKDVVRTSAHLYERSSWLTVGGRPIRPADGIGERPLVDGPWQTAPGKRPLVNGPWRTALGARPLANSPWRTAPSGQPLADSPWQTALGGWPLTLLENIEILF